MAYPESITEESDCDGFFTASTQKKAIFLGQAAVVQLRAQRQVCVLHSETFCKSVLPFFLTRGPNLDQSNQQRPVTPHISTHRAFQPLTKRELVPPNLADIRFFFRLRADVEERNTRGLAGYSAVWSGTHAISDLELLAVGLPTLF